MLFGLVADNAEVLAAARAYLGERSFAAHPVEALLAPGGRCRPLSLGVHHVVTGVTAENVALLRAGYGADFVLIRLAPAAAAPAGPPADAVVDFAAPTGPDALRAEVLARLRRVPRPDWDPYFMRIAGVVASRSNCLKRKVGALIVLDRRIIATGYNGTPRGAVNCDEGGCPRCAELAPGGAQLDACICSHAEENAIVQAAYHGTSVRGATLYVTFSPCLQCTKMIVNSGIRDVVYDDTYPLAAAALELLGHCGVAVRRSPAGAVAAPPPASTAR